MKNNRKKAIITITTIMFLAASACNNIYKGCKNMPEQTEGTGLIIKNAIIGFKTLDILGNSDEGLVITSESQNDFNLVVSFDYGESYNPIDFTKYTVLGKYADEGCDVVFDRDVSKYNEQQKYIYKIKVIHCGLCQKLMMSMNWVLIPKIEDDFSVDFIVDYELWKGK